MLSRHCSLLKWPQQCIARAPLDFPRVPRSGQTQLNSMTHERAHTSKVDLPRALQHWTKVSGPGKLYHFDVLCQSQRTPSCHMMRQQNVGLLNKYGSASLGPSGAAPWNPSDSYTIAVPSYDRAPTLKCRTLAALVAASVDVGTRVNVFVANKQEAEKYRKTLEPGTYASIIVGRLGIGKQRDFIMDHYGAGSNVVMLDDDIQWFKHMYSGNLNMHNVILRGFQLSQQHGCYMWGINNSSNKFFMRPSYSVGWCFFQGPFMAFRVRDEIRLDSKFHQTKEDVQYSLMHCELDGKVLRLNGVGLKARPYGREPGGLQSSMTLSQRAQIDQANQKYLMDKYGRYIRSWTEDQPHPSLKRSPRHLVEPLEF